MKKLTAMVILGLFTASAASAAEHASKRSYMNEAYNGAMPAARCAKLEMKNVVPDLSVPKSEQTIIQRATRAASALGGQIK